MDLDKQLETLKEENPLLRDKDFLDTHPDVENVALAIDLLSGFAERKDWKPKIYNDCGVQNIGEYLTKLQEGDPAAVAAYEDLREMFGTGEHGLAYKGKKGLP